MCALIMKPQRAQDAKELSYLLTHTTTHTIPTHSLLLMLHWSCFLFLQLCVHLIHTMIMFDLLFAWAARQINVPFLSERCGTLRLWGCSATQRQHGDRAQWELTTGQQLRAATWIKTATLNFWPRLPHQNTIMTGQGKGEKASIFFLPFVQ